MGICTSIAKNFAANGATSKKPQPDRQGVATAASSTHPVTTEDSTSNHNDEKRNRESTTSSRAKSPERSVSQPAPDPDETIAPKEWLGLNEECLESMDFTGTVIDPDYEAVTSDDQADGAAQDAEHMQIERRRAKLICRAFRYEGLEYVKTGVSAARR